MNVASIIINGEEIQVISVGIQGPAGPAGPAASGFAGISTTNTFSQRQTFSSGVTVSNPAVMNGVSYTFPGADGSSGQVLRTNGSGTLTWVAQPAAGVTSHPSLTSLDFASSGHTGFAGI